MNSKLYVGNMSFQTTEADLRQTFGQFGSVTDVYMGSDRITGRSRGFAFVTFSAEEESKLAAAQLNGSDVGGRRLSVSEARPREESTGARYGTADRQAPNDSRS